MSQLRPPVNLTSLLDKSWLTLKGDLPLVCALSGVYWLGVLVLSQIRISIFLEMPWSAGYLICLLRIAKKQSIQAKDFFYGFQTFPRFLHLCLAGVLKLVIITACFVLPIVFGAVGVALIPSWTIRILLGFLIFIPGFYVLVGTTLMLPILVSTEKGSIEAFSESLHIVNRHLGWFFRFCFVVGLLYLAGLCCFGIGVLITMPLSYLMLYSAYRAFREEGGPVLIDESTERVASSGLLQVNPAPSAPSDS